MTNVFQKAATRCEKHGKKSYTTRDLAKQASREMHDSGMREYKCDAQPGYWHIGHLPDAVRNGDKTADEHYGRGQFSSPPEAVQPLTFRPGPDNIRPLNGSKPSKPETSIESLLVAAEASGDPVQEKLARQIREDLIKLVDEMRIGQQKRSIEAEIAQRDAQIAKLTAEIAQREAALRELCGEPEPEAKPADRRIANLPPTADQAAIRAWARAETAKGVKGLEVATHGQVSLKVRRAWEQAMGVSA